MADAKKTSMSAAYKQAGEMMDAAPAKKAAPKPPAGSFVSDKTGTTGTMVTCPECGAHFRTEYH